MDPSVPGAPDDEAQRRIEEREERIKRLKEQLERGESFEKLERQEKIKKWGKLGALGLAAVLVVGGVAWGISELGSLSPECPVHEHASWRVFDNGTMLRFQHEDFDLAPGGNLPMRAHMHQPDDSTLHLEGDCASVGEFFGFMGMDLRPGFLRLDQQVHAAKVLRDEGNQSLRLFVMSADGAWNERDEVHDYQLRDQERLLITFGDETDEEIAAQQAQVPGPNA